MADWKAALKGIGAAGAAPAPPVRPIDGFRPLGVQFEVREVVRRTSGRWQHASKTTVAATSTSIGPLKLTVRPVIPGKGDAGWVGANLAWTSLQYQVHQLGLDPSQVRWFTEFAALARAQTGSFLGQDGVRISLDDFASRLLWTLLGDARMLDIALVGPGAKAPRVRVGERAGIRLDASAGLEGAVALLPVVTIDKADVTGLPLGAVGDHGLYAVQWPAEKGIGPLVRLAPSASPIEPAVLRLAAGGALVVPPEERQEFLEEVLPELGRAVAVVSSDDSVELPEPVFADDREGGDADGGADADGGFSGGARDGASGDPTAAVGDPAVDDLFDDDDADYLTGLPELQLELIPTDERDWLSLGFIVAVEGREVPFARLFEALAAGRKTIKMVDGSLLKLNQPIFEKLRLLIDEANGLNEWQTGLRLARTQLSLWEDFEDLADQSRAATEWREKVRRLTDAAGGHPAADPVDSTAGDLPRLPLPAGLVAELRPYQRDGFGWLVALYDNGLGGVLADDMGLGKTVQTLALIARAIEASVGAGVAAVASDRPVHSPWLVVAPSSVVSNWVAEAARFTPGLRVASVTRTQRRSAPKLAQLAAAHDVIVMSYNLFRLDFDDVEDVRWAGLVLDEAQFVKNRSSRAHECAKALDVEFKLAITGTPMENDLGELWAMFDLVSPGLFPSFRRFTEQYIRPISHVTAAESLPRGIDQADADRILARLRRRIRPFLLRRSKELVAPELPQKQEQVLHVELAPKHRRIYELVLQRERQKLLGLLEDESARDRFIVFRSITLLRMLALDASLIGEEYAGTPSSKLDALLEQLDDVVAEGHRALVFSQFTSYLGLAAERLRQRGIRFEYLDGSTTDRAKVIAAFKEGDAPVFLISLKAGGFGINLTEADYVFLLDPWWNPSSEAQAVDRAHRIGQDKKVMVYRIVADDTIEEKVMKLRDEKAKLFDAVLAGDGRDGDVGFADALTVDDIRGLLEP